MLINVTFAPTPISGIVNGIGLGVVGSSNFSTWVLTTTIVLPTYSMGKDKVQGTMASSTPLIDSNSLVVMTIGSF
jgi:hypothetical protein